MLILFTNVNVHVMDMNKRRSQWLLLCGVTSIVKKRFLDQCASVNVSVFASLVFPLQNALL